MVYKMKHPQPWFSFCRFEEPRKSRRNLWEGRYSRKMPEEVKEKQLSSIVPMYEKAPFEVMNEIVHIDSSLAAMQLMLVARSYGYDTNAIGGYKKTVLPKRLVLMKTDMCLF